MIVNFLCSRMLMLLLMLMVLVRAVSTWTGNVFVMVDSLRMAVQCRNMQQFDTCH